MENKNDYPQSKKIVISSDKKIATHNNNKLEGWYSFSKTYLQPLVDASTEVLDLLRQEDLNIDTAKNLAKEVREFERWDWPG